MEFESFNEGTLYTSVLRRKCNLLDSLLAIIGPEGTDISGIDNYKAKGSDESTEACKKLNQKKKKK
jgi:pyruvate dehydrogenase E2 component (dihydrolipoamide acetyltransferase)